MPKRVESGEQVAIMPKQVAPGEQIILKNAEENTEVSFTVPEQGVVLLCHNDIATAFIVHDYPFGRRLRCPVAYWTEHATKGSQAGYTRMVRATPKKSWCDKYSEYLNNPQHGHAAGLSAARHYFEAQFSSGKIHWNKPKRSTYWHLLCMELTPATDNAGDIQHAPDGGVRYSPSPLGLSMYDGVETWLRIVLTIGDQLTDNHTDDAQRIHTILDAMQSKFKGSERSYPLFQSFTDKFSLNNGILYRR